MNIIDFIQKAKKTKDVTFVNDKSKKGLLNIWHADIEIWSKSRKVLEDLSFHSPNDFEINAIDYEYMMQIFSTTKPEDAELVDNNF